MRWVALVAAGVALTVAAPTEAAVRDDAVIIARGIDRAVAVGRLSPDAARAHRAELQVAARLARRSPTFGRLLRLVAAHAPQFDEPRALILFSTLSVNRAHRGTGPRDVEDADGVVYRRMGSYGYQFHPLANFARLNAHASAGRLEEAARLSSALLARAVPTRGDALSWEYLFPFGGPAAWTSGMAQAVGAQAFARTAQRLAEPPLADAARRAFAAIPGRLVLALPEGPWVRLYSFSRLTVLNAQLQTVLSIADYAELTGDSKAAAFADRLAVAAAAALPKFDTGAWSLYSLRGREATLEYHDYVVSLLRRLAVTRAAEPLWRTAAARFALYRVEPPVISVSASSVFAYPWPRDGFLDDVGATFTLSKHSRVTLEVGRHRRTAELSRGSHRLAWDPRHAAPGMYYRVRLVAVDLAGNRAEVQLNAVELHKDTTPPDVLAYVEGARLVWDAYDEGTPWISLTLRLQRGGERRTLTLGRRPLAGSLRLRPPRGAWDAVLLVVDSAGNAARAELGTVHG